MILTILAALIVACYAAYRVAEGHARRVEQTQRAIARSTPQDGDAS